MGGLPTVAIKGFLASTFTFDSHKPHNFCLIRFFQRDYWQACLNLTLKTHIRSNSSGSQLSGLPTVAITEFLASRITFDIR